MEKYEYIDKTISWRYNLRKRVGSDILDCMMQKEVFESYLDILSTFEYQMMMDKEGAFVWDDKYLVWISHISSAHKEILCDMNLIELNEETAYYQIIFDSSKFKVVL